MGIEFFELTTRPKVCRRWESNALFTENFISLSVWKSDVLYKKVNATAAFKTSSEWGWSVKGELSEGKNTFFSWHTECKWFKKRRIFLLPVNYCLKKNVFFGDFRNFASWINPNYRLRFAVFPTRRIMSRLLKTCRVWRCPCSSDCFRRAALRHAFCCWSINLKTL